MDVASVNLVIFLLITKHHLLKFFFFEDATTPVPPISTTTSECACVEGFVACDDCTACIEESLRCDNMKQCSDGSDEINCPCTYQGITYEVYRFAAVKTLFYSTYPFFLFSQTLHGLSAHVKIATVKMALLSVKNIVILNHAGQDFICYREMNLSNIFNK